MFISINIFLMYVLLSNEERKKEKRNQSHSVKSMLAITHL